MQHLLIIEDDQGKRAVNLNADSGSIGRDIRNSIVLYSKEVSRQHAILLRVTKPGTEDYGFRIIDGNLQGKASTNGLFINGRRRNSHNLQHGDEVVFGANVKARYHIAAQAADAEWLLSGSATAAEYLATLIAAPVIPLTSDSDGEQEAAIAHLASFPELFSHPIIEISLTGELTYLNPATVHQFPTIHMAKMDHAILDGVIDLVQARGKQHFMRDIKVGDKVFEQAFHYIPQSDLIRCYLIDITDRTLAEAELQSLHDDLEDQVKERTKQVLTATEQLKQEQKALKSSYATNRALLNAIPDPMFRISSEGEFVNYSAPKHHPLPFALESCMHKHLANVLPDSTASAMQRGIDQVLATGEIEILEFQLEENNSPIYFEARIVKSASKEVIVIIRDITKRKHVETEIRNTLERERELNEMKTRFVSMTSHEFRTPLTTILSSAELLEHYGERWDETKRLQYLKKVQKAATHMTGLLNDVLLINKVEAGRMEFNPQPVILNEFCLEIIEELQITTDRHRLELRSQLPDTTNHIDCKLMRHILTNLLSNAINYSPSGGDVILGLDSIDGHIQLWVQDHGIGIPEDARDTLFESFVRGSNVGTISGTGLGLAIIKNSVELHQGQITFASTVGEGTTFKVTLPQTTPANAAAGPDAPLYQVA